MEVQDNPRRGTEIRDTCRSGHGVPHGEGEALIYERAEERQCPWIEPGAKLRCFPLDRSRHRRAELLGP